MEQERRGEAKMVMDVVIDGLLGLVATVCAGLGVLPASSGDPGWMELWR